MADNQDAEPTAAEYADPPASHLKRADELTAIADQFIADQRPWMAEGYQILAGMHRETAAAIAAQAHA